MPRWRKATWALVIWSVLMGIWVVTAIGAVSSLENCAGQTGDALAACEAGTAIGGGLGVTFILFIAFLGFVVLGLIWLMSRPKDNVVVFGPNGQEVRVSEKEARRRVEKQGWTYQRNETPQI